MPHHASRRNSTRRHSNIHKRINSTLGADKVPRRFHPGNINKSKRIPTRYYCSSRLLPTQTQPQKEIVPNILSNTRTEVYSGGRLQQQTHSMGLPTNNYKRQRITKGHTGTKLLIPINKNAKILAISLLPTISKILEKLILKRINKESNPHDWIPNHQFGFRQAHSTIQKCHRVADTINKALENRQFCTAAFLDVSQAFDKVWHPGLLYKIK